MTKPKLILFLDKDNTLLGATAEQVLRMLLENDGIRDITIVSAGEENQGFLSRDDQMDSVLSNNGLRISGVVNPLTTNLLEYADWIICMDQDSIKCRAIRRAVDVSKIILSFPTLESLSTLMTFKPLDYNLIYKEVYKGCLTVLQEIKDMDFLPITDFPHKLPVGFLFDTSERTVVRNENLARVFLEIFYRSLVEEGNHYFVPDFNDLITVFHSTNELVLLPVIDGDDMEVIKRSAKVKLMRECLSSKDIVLFAICPSEALFNTEEASLSNCLDSLTDNTTEEFKHFTTVITNIERKNKYLSILSVMIIRGK